MKYFPVTRNGNWGSWGSWSTCSKTCDRGVRRKYRRCNNPAPSNGGQNCAGSSSYGVYCNTQSCPGCIFTKKNIFKDLIWDQSKCVKYFPVTRNGNWGSWSRWSTCSKTCDSGVKRKYRRCNNPAPSNGGRNCYGSSSYAVYCNTDSCKYWISMHPRTKRDIIIDIS